MARKYNYVTRDKDNGEWTAWECKPFRRKYEDEDYWDNGGEFCEGRYARRIAARHGLTVNPGQCRKLPPAGKASK